MLLLFLLIHITFWPSLLRLLVQKFNSRLVGGVEDYQCSLSLEILTWYHCKSSWKPLWEPRSTLQILNSIIVSQLIQAWSAYMHLCHFCCANMFLIYMSCFDIIDFDTGFISRETSLLLLLKLVGMSSSNQNTGRQPYSVQTGWEPIRLFDC